MAITYSFCSKMPLLILEILSDISLTWREKSSCGANINSGRECSKEVVQQGRSPLDERSVLSVREHGRRGTCLREAAPAKAGNAAGGFFQQTLKEAGNDSA